MKYKNLIFDIDGTLWDSRSIVAKGYNYVLEGEGLNHLCVTAEDLRPLFGKVMSEIADILFHSLPEETRYPLLERCMEWEHRFLENDPCDTIAYPKVKETIAKLAENHNLYIVSNSQKGYPELCMSKLGLEPYIKDHLCFVSNSQKGYPQLTMQKLGVTHLFKGDLCFGDTGTSKGKTIRKLMERNGIPADDVIYIGDTQGDYEATLEAGVPFIWCTFGFGVPEGYESKIDAFEELLNL